MNKNILNELFYQTSYDESRNLSVTFRDRQIFTLKLTLFLNFSLKFIFLLLNFFDSHESPYINTNALTIVVSCVPAFYFLQTNKITYAKFFTFFPALVIQALSSYYVVMEGLPYGNAELALLAYIPPCVIFYKRGTAYAGIILNILFYVIIKLVRFDIYHISEHELILDLTMSVTSYTFIVVLSYLYKDDFFKLKENNDKLYAQKQIIESQSQALKTLNSTKDRLFSIIAHDLRGPLSSLKGVMQLLDNEHINKDEFKQLLKRLQENVDNVHGMLENLLLWSLSQMDGIKPTIKPFDLNFVLQETVELFREVFMQKNIDLISSSHTNQALGDEYQIGTVIRNILNNAIKFTPENGKIMIESGVEGNWITLKISDTGIGITKEDLPLFFSNPKLQAGTAGEKGTGFGLFLCKELVEKNGGIISVDSELGKWTTIEISLPLMIN